ncbi:MAG: DUF2807 domain-containing protein [Bacteroidales bacterium]|nr:DUF2807 domain-containing protein [Bacteroidales bacterium]
MKKLVILLLAVAAIASCTVVLGKKTIRGNGVMVSQSYEVAGFNSITVNGAVDVIYSQGPQSVVLTADENIIGYYEIESVGGVLRIDYADSVNLCSEKDIVIRVSSEDLSAVKINGAGDCEIVGGLSTGGDFNFILNGSGDLEADAISCNSLTTRISGSGDVDVDAATAKTVSATISGSGDIEIGCKKVGDLIVKINGSGDVKLYGEAGTLTSRINGSGGLDTKGLILKGI